MGISRGREAGRQGGHRLNKKDWGQEEDAVLVNKLKSHTVKMN